MSKRTKRLPILSLLSPLLAAALALPARAADTGQFLFAAPNPAIVQSGAPVRFQAIALNQGSETWAAGKAYILAEVFDAAGTFVGKTERSFAPSDVGPGKTFIADLSYAVPANFKGGHTVKIYVVNAEVRVAESSPVPFHVEGRPEAPPAPFPVTLGGSVIMSYRTQSGSSGTGETAVNMAGKGWELPYEFRMSTVHDETSSFDVRSLFFGTGSDAFKVGAGDVAPSFSPLAASGQGLRGVQIATKRQDSSGRAWDVSAIAGRAAEAVEGTATTDGTFRRMLYGAETAFSPNDRTKVSVNYVQVADASGSLGTPGPSLKAVENRTGGVAASWDDGGGLKAEAAFQRSSYKADSAASSAATDAAWRLAVGMSRKLWDVKTSLARTGSDFTALGAPGVAKDRLTFDLGVGLRPRDGLNLNGAFNQWSDDLKDDPAKVGTTQRTVTLGVTAAVRPGASVNAGLSLNSVVGSPSTTQDNRTTGLTLGFSQGWTGGALSGTFQRTSFEDQTNASPDLLTNTFNLSWNTQLGPKVKTTFGATASGTKDQGDGSILVSQTLSAAFNAALVPDRWFGQAFVSATFSDDNDAASRSDRRDLNMNLEATFKASESLSLTLGGFRNRSTDFITSSGSTSYGGSLRAAYNF